jgi:hypothetical protein
VDGRGCGGTWRSRTALNRRRGMRRRGCTARSKLTRGSAPCVVASSTVGGRAPFTRARNTRSTPSPPHGRRSSSLHVPLPTSLLSIPPPAGKHRGEAGAGLLCSLLHCQSRGIQRRRVQQDGQPSPRGLPPRHPRAYGREMSRGR